MRFQGDAGLGVQPQDGAHDVLEVAQEPLGGNGSERSAGLAGETRDDLGQPGPKYWAVCLRAVRNGIRPSRGARARRDESGDAGDVVGGGERVVADHHVQSAQWGAVGIVDSQPGRVAHDVEARMHGMPLLRESAAEETVDFDAPVEFLTEVLAAGVGDTQAQRQLEHRGGSGSVDGSYGGGGPPGSAVSAEVTEQSRVQQGSRLRMVPDLARLPGVQGQKDVPVRQRQAGTGQACGEPGGGDRAAALGPGGVGGEYGGSDSHPVQGEGTAQLG